MYNTCRSVLLIDREADGWTFYSSCSQIQSKNNLPMRFSEGVSVAGLPQCTAGLGSTLVFAVNESNVDLDRTHGADDLSGFVRVSHEQQTKPAEEEGQEVRSTAAEMHRELRECVEAAVMRRESLTVVTARLLRGSQTVDCCDCRLCDESCVNNL